MQYAIVHNTAINSLVALPSISALSDLAFDKGWRVIHQDTDWIELQDWKSQFNLEVMDDVQFYLDYLADEELTDDDIAYINATCQDYFTENQADSDEEEFDVEFFGEESTEDDEE